MNIPQVDGSLTGPPEFEVSQIFTNGEALRLNKS